MDIVYFTAGDEHDAFVDARALARRRLTRRRSRISRDLRCQLAAFLSECDLFGAAMCSRLGRPRLLRQARPSRCHEALARVIAAAAELGDKDREVFRAALPGAAARDVETAALLAGRLRIDFRNVPYGAQSHLVSEAAEMPDDARAEFDRAFFPDPKFAALIRAARPTFPVDAIFVRECAGLAAGAEMARFSAPGWLPSAAEIAQIKAIGATFSAPGWLPSPAEIAQLKAIGATHDRPLFAASTGADLAARPGEAA